MVLVTANLLEEMAWTGFVQTKLMARHGLLRGALLTAVPVFAIHLPLSYETDGLYRTRWEDALLNWGLLLVALLFFRYLAGVLMLETNGSVLAVGRAARILQRVGGHGRHSRWLAVRARRRPPDPAGRWPTERCADAQSISPSPSTWPADSEAGAAQQPVPRR